MHGGVGEVGCRGEMGCGGDRQQGDQELEDKGQRSGPSPLTTAFPTTAVGRGLI